MTELAPAKFKVGDHITVHDDSGNGSKAAKEKMGQTGVIDEVKTDRWTMPWSNTGRAYRIITDEGIGHRLGEDNLKLTNPERETTMSNDLINEIQALDLTDDQRLLIKHGLVERNGKTPTDKGNAMATYKLFQEKTASILEDLKKVDAARAEASK